MRLQDARPKSRLPKAPPTLGQRYFCRSRRKVPAKGCAVKNLSGRGTRPGFEGGQNPLYRHLPKLKSFPIVNRKEYTTINVSKLASLPANTEVTLTSLIQAKIVTTNDGPLKILGDGELNVPLQVRASAFTAGARTKIEAAGGSCELVA